MPNTSEPLRRAAAIVDLVALEPDGMTVGEIAENLLLPVPTVFRFVRKLVDIGYLEGEGRHALYVVGPRLSRLANRIQRGDSLSAGVDPILQRVADRLGVSAYIAGFFDNAASLLTVRMPSNAQAPSVHPGPSWPIHASASGKVLLAYQSEEVCEGVIRKGLDRFTDNTITEPDKLRDELSAVREQGFAVTVGERDPSLWGIACPVLGPDSSVGYAVGLAGFRPSAPDERDLIEEALPVVQDAATMVGRLFNAS